MKGITNQPLTIWVDESLFDHPETLKLMAAGHRVLKLTLPHADLVLSPVAHRWSQEFFDGGYLPAALAAARSRKRKEKK